MKRVAAVVMAASLAVAVTGCAQRGNGVPPGFPPTWPTINLHFAGHDGTDFEKVIEFNMIITGHALNSDVVGGFVEPDTGQRYNFRTVAGGPDIPVELTKRTPYGIPFVFPPREVIEFTVRFSLSGYYGDAVVCDWQRANPLYGQPGNTDGPWITVDSARTVAKVLNVPKDLLGAVGTAEAVCVFTAIEEERVVR